ncbi:AMP-binding protein [Streptomyces goshikiensis]|uniref:AMP-binding protein n=1 Tax=Streptomyces goshikiensis TaxID=1942 RepID=UPI0036B4BCFE
MLSPLLHHRVALRATQSPSAVAVIDGQRHVTYAELEERAALLAGHLRAQGVGPEGLVGVLLPRGLDLVVALLGIWKAGAAYVPLDTTHPADRVRRLLSDTGASVVVTDAAAVGMLAGTGASPLIAADALAGPAGAGPQAALRRRPSPRSWRVPGRRVCSPSRTRTFRSSGSCRNWSRSAICPAHRSTRRRSTCTTRS